MANYAEFSDVVALGDVTTGVLTGLGNVRVTVVDIASGLNASIYSDRAGAVPITNPIVTAIGGKVQFFALDSKKYRLDIHDLEAVARIGDQSVYWDSNIPDVQSLTNVMLSQSSIAPYIGINDGTTVRRGKSIIATSEARTSGSYGLLATPDRVQNVVVSTGSLLFILFSAMVSCDGVSGGRAAIFIGANQLKTPVSSGAPAVDEAAFGNAAADFDWLTSCSTGLTNGDATGAATSVTTGMTVAMTSPGSSHYGTLCVVRGLAAGTYDVSVQYKIISGTTLSAKERELYVEARDY